MWKESNDVRETLEGIYSNPEKQKWENLYYKKTAGKGQG